MADKKTTSTEQSKTAPAAKTSAKSVAKTTATEKPKTSTAKSAAKPTATAQSKTAEKPKTTAKPATTAKATTTKATTAKPVAKTTTTATAKPVAKTTVTNQSKTATTEKPKASEQSKTVAATTNKPQKTKSVKSAKTGKTSKSGGAVALTKKQIKIIAISAVAFILVLAIVLGSVLGVKACNRPKLSSGPTKVLDTKTVTNEIPTSIKNTVLYSDTDDGYNFENKTVTQVGYYGEVLGTVERNRPVAEVKDERTAFGVESGYPKYGSTLKSVIGTDEAKQAARQALVSESAYLVAWGTIGANRGGEQTPDKYTKIDADGYLYQYKDGEWIHSLEKTAEGYGTEYRRLYKHTASVGLYLGDVSDDEKGIVKRVTLRPRGYSSYNVTGVYAPAGEVIKIQVSDADMTATGGLTVHIGQALYNGQANNIWVGKNQMQRMPHILTSLEINKTTAVLEDGVWTAYVGSFLGGPIYIRHESVTFTATISGGVPYQHFILGYTTPEEFAENAKSSAPYFDLEVWHNGVLHSGPKSYAKNFSYEQLYNAAVLWDKVASVTTTGSNQGIVFLYDAFVAAGAAVAFPGRSSVNCPLGWMSSSLNYNAIVTSGSWGNFHEYHHNFQGYGVGNGGEVTNNGMTLVSYALFTKISSKRGISNFGAQGLGGWNNYTSAPWALEQTLKIARSNESPENGNQGLALYATLLHNFGADNYIKAKVQGGGQSYAAYMKAWQTVTHNNMYYYFHDVLKGDVSETADPSYPVFVPVSSVYQTGRSYMYDGEKRYFTTMQPYVIPFGEDFNIDLSKYTAPGGQYASGSVVIPEGFSYRVKSITKPEHGTIELVDNFNFKYTPDKNYISSGKIIATLEIIKNDGKFKVDDVDLVLEFEQTHEANKMTLDRTTYTYSADKMYTDAEEAYNAGFKNYTDMNTGAHSNPVQNCNTDIWFYPDTEANRTKYPDAPESYFVHENTIEVIDGKLYLAEEGKYRIYLRGRTNCALYYSLDGKDYKLGATIKSLYSDSANFHPNDENTYFDIEVTEKDVQDGDGLWVYIKEVLIVQTSPAVSYIGVGMTQWTVPMYTTTTETDEDGNVIATHYFDANGKEVTAEEASNTDPIPPTKATYVNAYRSTYEFPDNSSYKSDYFYVRSYNYNFVGTAKDYSTWDDGVKIVSCNKDPWDNTTKIDNLLVSGQDTFFHSNNASNYSSGAMVLELDMGKEVTANNVTFYGRTPNAADTAQQGLPKEFTVEVSTDGVNYFDAGTYTNSTGAARSATVSLNGTYKFRYVKLTIKSTHSNNKHFILSGIKFTEQLKLSGGGSNHYSPDRATYSEGFKVVTTNSVFGHAYLGKSGEKITFTFEGKRLAILNTTGYGLNYEVYIDGKKYDSVDAATVTGAYAICYLSEELPSGTHKVEIRCTGEACFDSFAIYK